MGRSESDAWELDIATAYDSDGHPTETKDARGGGRIFAWNSDDHTTLQSETVKLERDNLTETATIDGAFGNLLSVTGYDGQTTSFAYDGLGRLTATVRPETRGMRRPFGTHTSRARRSRASSRKAASGRARRR